MGSSNASSHLLLSSAGYERNDQIWGIKGSSRRQGGAAVLRSVRSLRRLCSKRERCVESRCDAVAVGQRADRERNRQPHHLHSFITQMTYSEKCLAFRKYLEDFVLKSGKAPQGKHDIRGVGTVD